MKELNLKIKTCIERPYSLNYETVDTLWCDKMDTWVWRKQLSIPHFCPLEDEKE